MTDMRTRLAGFSMWLGLCLCGSAQANSCGESVRVKNPTDRAVTVLIKSFYGTGFAQPDRNDFAPESTWRPGTMPFIRLYEVSLEPGATHEVFVRTLCQTPDRRHWINWSYSVDGATRVSGQEDLITTRPSIVVEPAAPGASG